MQLGDDVAEKCDVASRFPRQCRPWLIAEARPINRDGREGRCEPLLKGAHLVPDLVTHVLITERVGK